MFACLLLATVAIDPLIADHAVVDRGDVLVGPALTQRFKLTNTGSSLTVVTDIRSTCGCLAPILDRRELRPGETTALTIEVNTLSQPAGRVSWITRLTYRCGNETKILALDLHARLIAEVRVEPASVAFSIRQTRSVDVAINDTRSKPFQITGVGTSLPNVKAELMPAETNGTRRIRLTASPDGPAGVQSAFAWFTTNDPSYPQIKIPVTVTVPARQRIIASPSTIDMSAGSNCRILVRDQEGQPVMIDRCEVEGLTTSVVNNGQATVVVTLCSDRNRADQDAILKIHVRAPVAQIISIPIIVR